MLAGSVQVMPLVVPAPAMDWVAVCPLLDLTLGLILGDSVTLLDATNQLVLLAVDDREIIVGQLAPLLLHLAGDLLSIAFDAIPVHVSLLFVWNSAPLCGTPAAMPPRGSC